MRFYVLFKILRLYHSADDDKIRMFIIDGRGAYSLQKMISVIIPVYNVEKYLEECLQSVSEQTYRDLDVILVDDGSTDLSGKICEQWSEKDSRFRVIHKKNGGLSDARNTGLNAARGELIAFVDSDDVIHRDMFRILYSVMEKERCGICCCGVEQGTIFQNQTENEKKSIKGIYTPEQAIRAIIEETDVFVTVWNKLYKRNIVEDIFFPKGRCNEDEFWSWRVIDRAVSIVSVKGTLYGYRQRENSIMNSRYSLKRLDLLDARAERLRFFEEKYPNLVRLGRCDLRFECIRAWQFSLLYLPKDEQKQSRKRIQAIIKEYPARHEDCRELPPGRRFWYLLSGITFNGTCSIRNRFHFGP